MIRAVLFDVDGVLAEAMVFARILDEKYGINEEMRSAFFQGPFKDCVLGRADLKQELLPYLEKWRSHLVRHDGPGDVEDFIRSWFEADSRTNDEMLDFAQRLRKAGIKCYLASTQESYRANYLENEMGLADRFDGAFFSCRLGCSKPDRAFYEAVFEAVCSMIDSELGDLLLIDDHEFNVEGARRAGWKAELYRFGDDVDALTKKYDLT